MEPRSPRAAAEVARMNTFFPLMPLLGTRWAKQRPFQGMRVAINPMRTPCRCSNAFRERSLRWTGTSRHGVLRPRREAVCGDRWETWDDSTRGYCALVGVNDATGCHRQPWQR